MTATATRTNPTSSSSSGGLFDTIAQMGHEQLVLCSDPSASYRGIIAVHSTTLGPALGGTRLRS
jgi:glutamate dehydrogenase/leucine dehydrogenase